MSIHVDSDSMGRVYKNGHPGRSMKGRYKSVTNEERKAMAESRRSEMLAYLQEIQDKTTVKALTEKFGVSRSTVNNDLTAIDGWDKVNQKPHCTLSDDQVEEVVNRLSSGETAKDIAADMGTCCSVVENVGRGKTTRSKQISGRNNNSYMRNRLSFTKISAGCSRLQS